MTKKLLLFTTAFTLASSLLFANDALRFNKISGDIGQKYEKLLLGNALESAVGFSVFDAHERISDAYEKKYGDSKSPEYDENWTKRLDNLGFFPMSNDKAIHDILLTSPQIAGFQPFNLLIYKKQSEDFSYVGHIAPETMLDITGVTNIKDAKAYVAMFAPLDRWVSKTFGGSVEKIKLQQALPEKTMMTFEFPVDRSGAISDFVEEFQDKFEAAFESKDYIIAGYRDYKSTYEDDLEMPFEAYDAFFVYGLCQFKFSYNLFNKGRPDAGVFAPCSMYFYIKKDANVMVVGMPRLATWVAVMDIKDPKKIAWTKKIDR